MRTTSAPLVSVIIPTYNRRALLKATLESLAKQDASPDDFEVIVADDGSEEDMAAVVGSVPTAYQQRFVRHERNGQRPAATRNLGARIAKGNLFLFLDTGLQLDPSSIRNLIAARAGSSAILLGAARGYDPDHAGYGSAGTSETAATVPDARVQVLGSHSRDIAGFAVAWAFAWSLLIAVDATTFQNVQGFDERFAGWGMEDLDFAYRISRTGKAFRWEPSISAMDIPHPRTPISNLLTNRQNQLQFLQQNPERGAELFVHCRRNWLDLETTVTRYEQEILPGLGASQEGLTVQQIMSACSELRLTKDKVVVFGASDPDATALAGITTIDPRLQTSLPAKLGLFGVRTPFQTRAWDTAVVSPHLSQLGHDYHCAVLGEARRIADRVIENAA